MIQNIKKRSIAIDMDGVLADIETHFIKWYHKNYGVWVKHEELLGKSDDDFFPEPGTTRKFVNTPGFFRELPVMPGAIETVKALMSDFEVYVVSAAMEFPQSLLEKKEWLAEYFPFISWRNIILCGDKSIIDTDYMIDDHCKNLDFCKGKAIMFNAAHNVNIDRHFRVNNWEETKEFFQAELNLKREATAC